MPITHFTAWVLKISLLILSVSSSITFAAEENANAVKALLDRMSRAIHEQSYDGHFVYVSDNTIQSLRILHTVKDGKEFERLSHLNGAALEVIRNGHELLCLHPGDHLMRLEHPLPSGAFARQFREVNSRLEQFYHFFKSGLDRVAGRVALRVTVEPVDDYRYGYDLWVDEDSGLLLKSVLYGKNKKPLETFEFIKLDIVDTLPETLFVPEETTQVHAGHYSLDSNQHHEQGEQDLEWSTEWVPPGFYMADHVTKYFPVSKGPINTLMYTDGLAAYSVFIETTSDADAKAFARDESSRELLEQLKQKVGFSSVPLTDKKFKKNKLNKVNIRQLGGTTAYSRQLDSLDHAYAVTVVGELPLDTLQRIAESVKKIR